MAPVGARLSTLSALCIIPPQKISLELDKIRLEHDKAYQRWMPHINICFPFLEDTGLSLVQKTLANHLDRIGSFEIILEKITHFEPKGRGPATVVIEPRCEPKNSLEVVYKALQEACPIAANKSLHNFHPHLTIAQIQPLVLEDWIECNSKQLNFPYRFTVDCLYMVTREEDAESSFKVFHEFTLLSATTQPLDEEVAVVDSAKKDNVEEEGERKKKKKCDQVQKKKTPKEVQSLKPALVSAVSNSSRNCLIEIDISSTMEHLWEESSLNWLDDEEEETATMHVQVVNNYRLCTPSLFGHDVDGSVFEAGAIRQLACGKFIVDCNGTFIFSPLLIRRNLSQEDQVVGEFGELSAESLYACLYLRVEHPSRNGCCLLPFQQNFDCKLGAEATLFPGDCAGVDYVRNTYRLDSKRPAVTKYNAGKKESLQRKRNHMLNKVEATEVEDEAIRSRNYWLVRSKRRGEGRTSRSFAAGNVHFPTYSQATRKKKIADHHAVVRRLEARMKMLDMAGQDGSVSNLFGRVLSLMKGSALSIVYIPQSQNSAEGWVEGSTCVQLPFRVQLTMVNLRKREEVVVAEQKVSPNPFQLFPKKMKYACHEVQSQ